MYTRFLCILLVTGIIFAGCSKKSSLSASIAGTYELRKSAGFGFLNQYNPGNDTLLIFCNGSFQEKINGTVTDWGRYTINAHSAKSVNYCHARGVEEDFTVHLLTLKGEKEQRTLSVNVQMLPGNLHFTDGCTYNDTGIMYEYARISECR